MSFSMTLYRNANRGNRLNGAYPLGNEPEAPASITSDPVTTAMDATGSGTRYDVYSDADIDSVPWATLGAGDVVNIFYKASPYLRKIGIRAQGTQNNPVVINGVTDASGNRPQFNFNGATTAPTTRPGNSNDVFSATVEFGESLGGIVVRRGIFDSYGTYAPTFVQIKNLEVFGAASGNTYTSLDGNTETYGVAAGIYFLLGEDCLVENCVIYDNGFGIFTQAKDELLSEACRRITVRTSRVYGNGISGSWYEHNFYVQCADPIIEGNYIGQVRSGSLGSTYKSRSSGEIFRYNYVEGSARVCDWVHSEQQGTDGIVTQANYGDAYVYGNTFCNDFSLPEGGALAMLHYGGDNLGEDEIGSFVNPSEKYRNQLYFWNNTSVFRGTAVDNPWRGAFFDLSLAVNNPNTSQGAPTTVDAWNNIFVVASSGAMPNLLSWTQYAGQLNLRGNNLLYGGTVEDYWNDALAGRAVVSTSGTLLTGDPALSNIVNQEYLLTTGSAAYNQATIPTAMSSVMTAYPIEYQPNNKTNGLVARTSVTSLGAYE